MGILDWLLGRNRTPIQRMGDETYDTKELMDKGYRWNGTLLRNKTTGEDNAIYYDGKGTRKGTTKRARNEPFKDAEKK